MALIKLENVSKYYYSNGNIVNALSKVNLEFNIGEVVAITGESGSGKSTLLNVISGMDTYEEGEMYVNNQETSAYDEEDLEKYRKNYIGFIFQNYNLIDSYTVLQNVEVVLKIQGFARHEIRKKALECIKQVGLENHLKHKGTQLSGGQKQRLSIARALAKNSEIIVADEPTGNLDQETGNQILKILADLATEKLVIIVTHEYEEVAKYATRKIRIFDGQVAEDKVIKKMPDSIKIVDDHNVSNNQKALNFALMNFKAQPKRTFLLYLVSFFTTLFLSVFIGFYLFITNSLFGGMNFAMPFDSTLFNNAYEERIVVEKATGLTEDDFQYLKGLSNVRHVEKNSLGLDCDFMVFNPVTSEMFYNSIRIRSIHELKETDLIKGTIVLDNKFDIVISSNNDFYEEYQNLEQLKIDGYHIDYESLLTIKGFTNNTLESDNVYLYVSDLLLEEINTYQKEYFYTYEYKKYYDNPLDSLPEELIYDGYCKGSPTLNEYLSISSEQLDSQITITTDKIPECVPTRIVLGSGDTQITYTGSNIIFVEEEYASNTITISENIYSQLYNSKNNQYSIIVDDVNNMDSLVNKLRNEGYTVAYPFAAVNLINDFSRLFEFVGLIMYGWQIILGLVIVFFIAYAILRNVLYGKNKDLNILRSVGLNQKTIKLVTLYEVFFGFILALISVIIFGNTLNLLRKNAIGGDVIKFAGTLYKFYRFEHYVILVVICLGLSLLLVRRFNKKIISKSVIGSIKGEM